MVGLSSISLISNASLVFLLSILGSITLLILAAIEFDPRKSGKVKLAMTERAKRIQLLHDCMLVVLLLIVDLLVFQLPEHKILPALWISQIAVFQSLPFLLIIAVILLRPSEKILQDKFLADAKRIVEESNSYIVGITGSYGKTSIKNALGEVLQVSLGSTFWPKKGINTLMGNTREIRNHLSRAYKYAVVEMAAYRKGSIEKLCKLTPPRAGIISAIGIMHLDRFGSEDTVYKAKTELARAIPEDGILVCNGDNPGARRAATEFKKKTTILYGFKKEVGQLDCSMQEIVTSDAGSSFVIEWKGKKYSGKTLLLGKPALSNLLAVFSMACALGATPEYVLAAISNLKPVDNRLSLDKHGKVVYLRDAYNSNPVGFSAALDVLKDFKAQRKILMTPGMVELGDRQYEENKIIAEKAGSICDLVILVSTTNRQAYVDGLKAAGLDDSKIIIFDHRDQALAELTKIQQDGDVILIENDLTDWYEDKSWF